MVPRYRERDEVQPLRGNHHRTGLEVILPQKKKAQKKTAGMGKQNLAHAMNDECQDPDCEIHIPTNIEDDNSMLTALAWYLVGAKAMARMIENHRVRPIKSDVKNLQDAMKTFVETPTVRGNVVRPKRR